jgi:hypothetical protein
MENFYNSTGVSSPTRTERTQSPSKCVEIRIQRTLSSSKGSSFFKSFALTLVIFIAGIGSVLGQCASYRTNVACTTPAPTTINGSISCTPPTNNGGRRNFDVTNMVAGYTYRISNCGSGFDTQMTIRNTSGTVVAYNDDDGPACSGSAASIDFIPASTGTYWIQLNRYDCATTAASNGTITVTLTSAPATCPTLTAPANAATGVSLAPTLTWTAGAYTSSYDVYLSTNQTDVTNQSVIARVSTSQAGTSYNSAALSPSTLYYWRVVPMNSVGTAATGCTTRSFTTAAATPTISQSGTLSAFSACANVASAQQSFSVSGLYLSGNLVVTAPTGFSVSTTSGAGFTSSVSLTPSSGTVSSTLIYVRMNALASNPTSGNIVCSSTSASSVNVAVSGTVANTAATTTTGASSSITGTSATLEGSYVANCQTITGYGIFYSTTNGFSDGAGTQVSSSNQSSGSFTSSVSGLSPSTTYYYKAYATNSSGSTVYGSQSSFTTTCATASIPWSEGFEGISIPALPSCWLEENGDYVTTDNSNSTYDANARTGSNFLRESWSATNEYIWTPGFSLTAGTSYDFSFYWAGDGYSSWVGDVFRNTTQSSSGATQIGSSFISNGTLASSTYSQCTRSFTPATSGTYYFAIRVNESTGSPWYLSFDDFSLTLTPACNSNPTNLNASNLTATTATVGWDAPSPAPSNGYEYAVTTSTTPPASGTATSNTSVAVTGLSATTTYYLHVRSYCGGSDYSNWVTSSAFTTPCAAISTFPWTETFSDNSTTRSCWTVRDGNADSDFWEISTSYPFDAGGSHASLYTDYNSTNQDYLITPQINLGSTGRQLKFQIRHYDNTEPDNIRVKLSTTGNDIANFTTSLLTLSTTQITTTYTEYSVNLSSYSGNVYIAFAREDAPADGWYVYIDEVKIVTLPTSAPTCATYVSPTNGESVVPASGSVPVSWNAVTDADSYDVYKNGSFVANTASTSYSLTGNTVGNSYTWYVVPKNSVGDASGCSSGAYSFTCISTPSNDDPCGAIALSISNSLTYTTYSNAGATATSGPPAPGCASYSTADVWFSVTVPASGIISFDSQTGTITDGGMAIYSGSCSSLTLIECDDDDSPNGTMPYISLTGRTSGETLWIRMWDYDDGTGTFGLCVRSQAADLTSATQNQNNVCPGTSVTLTANGVDGTAYWFTTCGTSGELGTGGTLNVSPSTTTTYYARNYRYGNFSTNCTSVTVTVTQPSTTISVANGVSIANGDYLWSGNTNTDGSVASNWYVFNGTNYTVATSAPTTQNVYIVSNTTATNCVSANSNPPSNPAAGTFAASNVYIGTDLTLTQANGSTFNVSGNFINNGTFTPGTGTVNMNGSTAQTIGGTSATTFNNLTINNAAGVSLNRAVDVSGILTLTAGRLSLGSNNLTLGTSASIGGSPSSSNMIVAASTGELRKRFTSGTTNPSPFTFPIGTIAGGNEYTPVILDFGTSTFGAAAYVGAKVSDVKNGTMMNTITNYINRNWVVEPNDISSYTYEIKLYYTDNDVILSGMGEGDIKPVKLSAGQWYQPDDFDATFTNAIKQGSAFIYSNSNYMVWGGLSTFSEFGGAGGSNQPLPVELVSFTGACEEGIINLTWQTASEFNSSHFDVEKSRDGENWQVLTTLPSAGTSNELITYQTTDQNATDGNNYFRLRQVDIDGTEKLYDPINVSCSEVTTGYFSSFPNPSGSAFQVIVNNKDLIGACTMNIVDASGKVIETRSIEVKDGINMFVINQELTPGIYFLNVTNGSKSTPVLRHAIK